MRVHHICACTIAWSVLFGTACAMSPLDDADEPVASDESGLSSTNRLSMNRLSANQISMRQLSTDPLSEDGRYLTNTDLLATSAGRELLSYIIRCALPKTRSLKANVGSAIHRFRGQIGLTPQWINRPLDASGQRWITACLLAHVNAYGVEVPISLRGNNPALTASTQERANYVFEEASYYGNIFESSASNNLYIYACAGQELQAYCDDTSTYYPRRSCSSSSSCILRMPGPCGAMLLNSSGQVCEYESFDWYADCHSSAKSTSAQWPVGSIDYREVITVYLRSSDFMKFYGSCGGGTIVSDGVGDLLDILRGL